MEDGLEPTLARVETGVEAFLRIGNKRYEPIFVGKADPAAGRLLANGRLNDVVINQIVVIDFLQGLVENAEWAFMQNVEAENVRNACPGNQAIGSDADILRCLVADALRDGDQKVLVDPVYLLEDQTFAVVP